MAFFNPKLPEKLNICLVTKRFPYPGRGSDENYLWPIAKAMVSRGHNLTVLAWQNPRGGSEYISGNVKIYFLGEKIKNPSRRHFATNAHRKFIELHQTEAFHIMHSLDESGILIAENRKKYGIASAFDVSATQLSQVLSILGMKQDTVGGLLNTGFAVFYKFLTTYYGSDRAILKSADAIFCASPLQQIMLERYYMYPELKTYIVPYGMDFVELDYKPKSIELCKKLGIPEDTRNVVTVTDMTELAEVTNLLRAFAKEVVKKPNSRLIIIGDGPLKRQIEFQMLNLVLGSKTIFIDRVTSEEMSDYIGLADVYVNLSSRTTGFEPTMLEAMAQKKIVIGSELSPISTIIEDGRDGFLVRPADSASLAELFHKIFTDQIKSVEVGNHAREKVLGLFNVEQMSDQILGAYYEILKRTGRKPRPIRRIEPSTKSPNL